MSFPTIPDINPDIDMDAVDAVNLLLASIAFEELGLAHLINAEAEKIQFVIGTLDGPPDNTTPPPPPTIDDLLQIDRSVEQTLRSIIKNEMLLQFKLEDVLSITTTSSTTTSSTSTSSTSTSSTSTSSTSTSSTSTSSTSTSSTSTSSTSTSSTSTSSTSTSSSTTSSSTTSSTTSTMTTTTRYVEAGSAWSVGTQFGNNPNSGYFTLASDQNQTSAVLGLGAQHTPVGTVDVVRDGNNLNVTISTNSPFLMSQAHLYVNNVAPTNSAPGQLGHTFDPGFLFSTHTFVVDVSAFAGQTIFIAAHAVIFEPV